MTLMAPEYFMSSKCSMISFDVWKQVMVWSSESFCVDCLTPPCDVFAPCCWARGGGAELVSSFPRLPHTQLPISLLWLLFCLKITSSSSQPRRSVSDIVSSTDFPNVNNMSNSSRARKGGSSGSFCRSAEVKQYMWDKFSASTWGHTLGHMLSQAVNANPPEVHPKSKGEWESLSLHPFLVISTAELLLCG